MIETSYLLNPLEYDINFCRHTNPVYDILPFKWMSDNVHRHKNCYVCVNMFLIYCMFL